MGEKGGPRIQYGKRGTIYSSTVLLLAENGKETVDNNGKWNVYKGGKLVKQYEGFGRTPEQMKELCKKIQNEFK